MTHPIWFWLVGLLTGIVITWFFTYTGESK
jgi:hypothetical protein